MREKKASKRRNSDRAKFAKAAATLDKVVRGRRGRQKKTVDEAIADMVALGEADDLALRKKLKHVTDMDIAFNKFLRRQTLPETAPWFLQRFAFANCASQAQSWMYSWRR